MTFFHVANGHATTTLIARAGIPGETGIWADALHDGPVPAGLDDEGLRAARAGYLATRGDDGARFAASLAFAHTAIARSAACDELVLWFEHDLFDQLNLIHLLDRIAAAPAKAPAVSLICIGSFPGRPDFKGLGELTPGELAPLLDTRQPVTAAQCALGGRAWQAFRDPDPRAIEALLREDLSPLPFLGAALRRHLEDFPSTRDGLSRTERRVLEIGAGGPIDRREAFPRMHDGETSFYIGDLSYFAVVDALAALRPVLLEQDAGRIRTTAAGRQVLDGVQDRVALCGIDQWRGGVHLAGPGPVWRWTGEALQEPTM
jgi:hypothetical protein